MFSRARRWLLAAALANAGCLSCLHPMPAPPVEEVHACDTCPPCCRNHVYVFFLNGFDLFDSANLSGLRKYVQQLGFIKTYDGQFYHASAFAVEMRRLHNEDPQAHFVVVGYGYGA